MMHALLLASLSWTPSGSGPLLTGLVAPTFSPFHANGTLDIAGINRQAHTFARPT